jgi:FkbM family methyltransferase
VGLHYREEIGLSTLIGGGFERVELEHSYQLVRPGTTAVDVGANIGLHTVVLACAVGPHGTVLAFEPAPANLLRLGENLALNAATNVDVHPTALAETPGQIVLHLAGDGLYHSTGATYEGGLDRDIQVAAETLDDVWEAAGTPTVSFVKIDTEGTEFSVLRGAERLLTAQSPVILIENRDARITPWLGDRGYVGSRPPGFAAGNMLFRHESLDERRQAL